MVKFAVGKGIYLSIIPEPATDHALSPIIQGITRGLVLVSQLGTTIPFINN
jgi:hypothetical protein